MRVASRRGIGFALFVSPEPSTLHADSPGTRTSHAAGWPRAVCMVILVGVTLGVAPATSLAKRLDIRPGSSFENAVEHLAPGDTLTVHDGLYADRGRISITVPGTSGAPVLIRGASGEPRPLITRPDGSEPQNTINIEGATYLTIAGLEISGNGDGINLKGDIHDVTIENCVIHNVDVGIGVHSSARHLVIRRNEIRDTGSGGNTGEGMYIGCHDGSCAVTESMFEGNWIHDTLHASQGDGIEIKLGSWGNVVRDNVIYNTHYPGVILYGTQGGAPNVVERNALWNCADSGIQAAADAIIRNNLILDCPDAGFTSHDHNGVRPGHLVFVNNTIVGGNPALRLSDWANRPGMVFANNAIYTSSDRVYAGESLQGVTVTGNIVLPSNRVVGSGGGAGRSIAADFLQANHRNVYPSAQSKLIRAGVATYAPREDFNGTPRSGKPDVGAYAWTQARNPGWTVAPGFKSVPRKPAAPPAPPKRAAN